MSLLSRVPSPAALIVLAMLASTATACHGPRSSASTPSSALGPSSAIPSSASPVPANGPASAAPSAVASPPATPPTPSAPAFSSTTARVTPAELGNSYHVGCPVSYDQLREVTLTYWGFDNAAHTGRIVVNATVVPAVARVFKTLYDERFPIRRMEPVADFGGSDDASMAADNTSAFNCRNAVAAGPPRWSVHAYGKAIDVNTVENPYLDGGKVLPPAGAAYATRTPYRPGMAVAGGQLVKAFAAVGWYWGGRWSGSPDYQHFSATGG